MSAYEIALIAHSYTRWVLCVLALSVVGGSALSWRRDGAWTLRHARIHRALTGIADLQFSLGVALYIFWSPFAHAFFNDPATAMKERTLRFFGLEHPTMMLLAVALLHVGRTRAEKAQSKKDKHRAATCWTLAALLVVLSSIPWPGLRHGRPLFRKPATAASAAPG